MKLITITICTLFCLLFFGFRFALPDVPGIKHVKKTPDAVKAGSLVYINKCKTCHENTEIDMSKKTYTQMMPMLASMVDMEKLNRKEIDNVAAYVYAVSKK